MFVALHGVNNQYDNTVCTSKQTKPEFPLFMTFSNTTASWEHECPTSTARRLANVTRTTLKYLNHDHKDLARTVYANWMNIRRFIQINPKPKQPCHPFAVTQQTFPAK